jgi:predicted small lipoprotein YifL
MLFVLRDSEEHSLAFDRLSVRCALAVLIAAAFGLAACGRAGPPEAPPKPWLGAEPTAAAPAPGASASTTGEGAAGGSAAQTTAVKNGFDVNGNPVAPLGQKKSFFLDPLLQ